MRLWQPLMITLARSGRLKRFMQRNAQLSELAGHFVGGRDTTAACATALQLKAEGFRASLYYLGEYVADAGLVQQTVGQEIAIATALRLAGLDVHVSVDPTQLGYMIGDETGAANMLRIGRTISELSRAEGTTRDYMMLDMEDILLVDKTLALRTRLVAAGVPTAQTLQAYLYRTEQDLLAILHGPARAAVRLVKGAFAERRDRAWQTRADICRNYLHLAGLMLSAEAQRAGFYPIFGTHDDVLIWAIRDLAARRGWTPDRYEFEMLYGVRRPLQEALKSDGQTVRLYLPFGEDWWPYAARRVGETPRNALLALRAVASAMNRR